MEPNRKPLPDNPRFPVKMGLYAFLNRIWRSSSYSIKFLGVAIIGTHTLLASAFSWAMGPSLPREQIIIFLVVERVLALGASIWLLWSLLAPIRATVQFLEEYIRTGRITDLPTHFTDDAGRLMASTHHVVTELDRSVSELARASSTDPLTGLPNRRFAIDRLAEDARRAETGEFLAVLVLIDLDNLKITNDTHGHPMGDEHLRKLAAAISFVLEPGDWLARWGGDEYLAVFWGSEANAVSKRLDCAAESLTPCGVSFSAGLTRLYGNVDAALERADDALYQAKRDGKGRAFAGR